MRLLTSASDTSILKSEGAGFGGQFDTNALPSPRAHPDERVNRTWRNCEV
jgi:hypothetical protein